MSTIDSSTPRQRFAAWNKKKQDLWLDLFESFSGILLGAAVEEGPTLKVSESDEDETERYKDAVRMAAIITDAAIEEAQYRFWIQESRKPKRRTR